MKEMKLYPMPINLEDHAVAFMIMRNGIQSYRETQKQLMSVAQHLSSEIEKLGMFDMVESPTSTASLCWTLKDDDFRAWNLYDLDDSLRMRGWEVPAFQLTGELQNSTCQRITCSADLTMDMADTFLAAMREEIARLDNATVIGIKRQMPLDMVA